MVSVCVHMLTVYTSILRPDQLVIFFVSRGPTCHLCLGQHASPAAGAAAGTGRAVVGAGPGANDVLGMRDPALPWSLLLEACRLRVAAGSAAGCKGKRFYH
jgi:hypothetical protein